MMYGKIDAFILKNNTMEQPTLDYLKRLSNGDEGIYQTLIGVIKKEFPVEKESYLSSVQAKDYKLIEENVHRLKHKINVFGLEDSYKTANKFEQNLRNKSFELKEDFDKVLSLISNFIKTL